MEKLKVSESSAQQNFILRIRDCADKIASLQTRSEVLCNAARFFTEFAGASESLIIDLSRNILDVYRSGEEGEKESTGSTVILEESVGPLLELLCDRYLQEPGIRVFNRKIVEPLEGIPEDAISPALEELGINQGFILPLTVLRKFGAENVHGILLISELPTYRFADPSHFALLRMAADLLSLAADNRDLGNALARIRPTDQVTGLASRNRLLSSLNQEICRAEYLNRSFCLVLSDIDNFKSLNVRQGYRYGDLVIKTVAEDILSEARPIDIVCRWGGEEYLVLMPEVSQTEAFEFSERCRNKVKAHPIAPNDYLEELFVTLSFGLVSFPTHGETAEILLRNAELSLLQAKLNGRNQTNIWSPQEHPPA